MLFVVVKAIQQKILQYSRTGRLDAGGVAAWNLYGGYVFRIMRKHGSCRDVVNSIIEIDDSLIIIDLTDINHIGTVVTRGDQIIEYILN